MLVRYILANDYYLSRLSLGEHPFWNLVQCLKLEQIIILIIRTRFWNYRAMSRMWFYILANGYCMSILSPLEHGFGIIEHCLECSSIFRLMAMLYDQTIITRTQFWNFRVMSGMWFYIPANGYCMAILSSLEHSFGILESFLECGCMTRLSSLEHGFGILESCLECGSIF